MKRYAVLTGDLIESRSLAAAMRKELLEWLKKVAADFSALHKGTVIGEADVFRGDSWQLCIQNPTLAIEAAVFMRAGLKANKFRKKIDTRIGIGIGRAEAISKRRISESNGEAFVRSGEALDSLRRGLNLSLNWPDGPAGAAALAETAIPLLDLAVNRWSHAESVAVYGVLSGWTQQETAEHELARKPGGAQPTRQGIAKALHRIHWNSHLEPALAASQRILSSQGTFKSNL